MLEEVFQDVYTKFKLHFYQNVFQRFATREATLTTVESFCMEGIMAMGEPTIAEFSRMMGISTPNAAYKIGSLVKKGYVEKIQSTTDRREYFLRPTQTYIDDYSISFLTCTRSSGVCASASRLRTATRWSRCSRSSAPS